jgi:hypothetical protein
MLLILSLFFLFLGAACYFLFRDNDLLIYKILHINPLTHASIPVEKNTLTDFVRNNAPDGLWLLSGILLLRFLWYNDSSVCAIYLISFFVLAFMIELLQLIPAIPGTFDVFDILTMVIIALAEHFIHKFLTNRRTLWLKVG